MTKASEMNISVVCKENLEATLQRATFGENAERIYAEALANLNAGGQIPLEGDG